MSRPKARAWGDLCLTSLTYGNFASALRRLACVDPEARVMLSMSKGRTPSNSVCGAFNKDVQKGVDVTVDGVRGVCR
jgi:hypothetical protein